MRSACQERPPVRGCWAVVSGDHPGWGRRFSMGAKPALLAFVDGDLRPALRSAVRSDPVEVIDLVRGLHPSYEVTAIGDGSLGEDAYPPDDTSYATIVPGAELFCDRMLIC